MKERKKGLFCVIEGMDGAGKSTLLATFSNLIQKNEFDEPKIKSAILQINQKRVIFLREPTDLPTGKKIRQRLSELPPPTTQEWIRLFREDRQANLSQFVEPGLAEDKIVIQDRYFYSTAAYQGAYAEEGALSILKEFDWCLKPDLLIFLKVDEETAFKRMDSRAKTKETFEERDQWRKINEAYSRILPNDTIFLDASWEPEELAKELIRKIYEKLQ